MHHGFPALTSSFFHCFSLSLTPFCDSCLSLRTEGLYGIVISDSEGAVYSRVMRQDTPHHVPLFPVQIELTDTQGYSHNQAPVLATDPGSVVFATTTGMASKLGLGTNSTITTLYEDYLVMHVAHLPLIITFVASLGVNRGLIVAIVPELQVKLERLRLSLVEDNKSEIDLADH